MNDANKNANVVWTDDQERAISVTGGSVLVTASAGAGKTAVLTERIFRRITAKTNPLDLRRLVVVTFTKAAAAEMKERITKKLSEYIAAHPDDGNAKLQLMHVRDANISTIDSFCMSLIEKHQAEKDVGYVPGVRILQDSEKKRLLKKAITEAIDEEYSREDNGSFFALADAMSNGGGDGNLKDIVAGLRAILSRSPDPEKTRAGLMERFEDSDYCDVGKIFGRIFENLRFAAEYYSKTAEKLITEEPCPEDPGVCAGHISQLRIIKGAADCLKAAAEACDAEACAEAMASCVFEGKLTKKKAMPQEWHDAARSLKAAFSGFCKGGVGDLTYSEEKLREEARLLRPMIAKLFETVALADKKYAALKKDRGVWDFDDIELKALSLLWEKGADGKLHRTAISLAEAAGYDEILIDEYQDVNELQEKIFNGISSAANQDNVFMVGDVKQSIYRFRGAAPRLFLNYRDSFRAVKDGDVEFPAKIALNKNFRSRVCITDAVNAVFDAIMTPETAGIDYANEDRLVPADKEPKPSGCGAFLTIIGGKSEDEARYVAAKIKTLMESGFEVKDGKGGARPLRYGDIAILMRTIKNRTKPFVDAFAEAGIPVSTPESGDPLQVPEVGRIISVLRSIDNPMKDINLAAAMRSDVFGFTDSELADIRSHGSGAFYYAVKAAADAGNAKCADFIRKLDDLRRMAATLTADKLIWYIYKTASVLAFASMGRNGARVRAALMLLYESAVAYGASGRRDLSGFVSYIDSAVEEGGIGTASVGSSGGDVTIMSIHKSKGLEFPVCFICDTAHAFSADTAPFIADESAGLGIKLAFASEHLRRSTAALTSASYEAESDEKREEMRLLYVAMTRAIDRLEIVGAVSKPDEFVRDCAQRVDVGGRMDKWPVKAAKKPLEWVVPAALANRGVFEIEIDPAFTAAVASGESREAPEPDAALAERISARINAKYEHSASVTVPTKLTVSEIVAMKAGKSGSDRCCERRPACMDVDRRGGAEAGTATHAFLQFADFDKLDDPEAELERLVSQRFITEKQAEMVDRHKLDNFISSELFKRIRAAEKVTREFRFTFETDASDYLPDAPDEKLLVQGAIDCVFEEDGKCVVVDYKTDRIKDDLAEKAAFYKPQLEIYARGLAELTGREVSEALLYFLDANEAVRVI